MLRGRFILAAALALLVASSTTAYAADNSLKLSGAAKNQLGQNFNWTISGFAGGAANRVVAYEQFYKKSGCASTYAAEKGRVSKPSYAVTLWLSRSVHAHYSLVAEFGADHAGVHGICAYLINRLSGQTYEHAGGWWDNVAATEQGGSTTPPSSGALQPAPVGSGECQAEQFSDGSVYAQIAVSNTSCDVAATVAQDADTAQGAPYTSDGFSCTATPEGPGSAWSSAWGGTYYAYSCADGSEQVAFNWGTDYTYDG
ncbi:MAG TPA: hypothetical protein VME22_15170 [Solirubrobacteraceae bacterium]|nr:hypothetical protein [Solirubrobacteraceae bacterium]